MTFKITAAPLYPDGATGDIFADIEADGLSSAMSQLEERILEWWPPQAHRGGDDPLDVPDALDVTVSW